MAVDIGESAIDRGNFFASGYTIVNKNIPATGSGTITSVEIFAYTGQDLVNCVVGTFYTTNGNTLKCRASEVIGAVVGGEKQTIPLDPGLAVVAGDYIGMYYTGGYMERDTSGFSGLWNKLGQNIDPDDEADYGLFPDDAISLGGYLEEVAVVGRSFGFIIG